MDLRKHLNGTFRVPLDEYFHEEAFLEMKDMNLEQVLTLKEYKDSEKEQIHFFIGILESLIVDHNFYDGNKKMGTKELCEAVKEDPWLGQLIYTNYLQKLFRDR